MIKYTNKLNWLRLSHINCSYQILSYCVPGLLLHIYICILVQNLLKVCFILRFQCIFHPTAAGYSRSEALYLSVSLDVIVFVW